MMIMIIIIIIMVKFPSPSHEDMEGVEVLLHSFATTSSPDGDE